MAVYEVSVRVPDGHGGIHTFMRLVRADDEAAAANAAIAAFARLAGADGPDIAQRAATEVRRMPDAVYDPFVLSVEEARDA